jgi:transmembrane sensor
MLTAEIAAEAAVWIARLHGPERSSQMERECLSWQAQSEAHRLAFERCTDTWQDVARVTLRDYATTVPRPAGPEKRSWPARRLRWSMGAALAGLAVGVMVVLQPWRDVQTYATGVGEQRTVLLQDGTRMSLNTATRVRVTLATAQRTVNVEEGEALFEVAKDANRSFVVRAADEEVVALGTVFSVRLTPTQEVHGRALAVTLIEGKVSVRTAHKRVDETEATRPILLKPGDRLRLTESGDKAMQGAPRTSMTLDHPNVDRLMAWRRSEAIFDDVTLSEAVAEMNRYSRKLIVLVGDASSNNLRISGLFRTGDNVAFARAVAALHKLVVHDRGEHLELSPG